MKKKLKCESCEHLDTTPEGMLFCKILKHGIDTGFDMEFYAERCGVK